MTEMLERMLRTLTHNELLSLKALVEDMLEARVGQIEGQDQTGIDPKLTPKLKPKLVPKLKPKLVPKLKPKLVPKLKPKTPPPQDSQSP